MRTEFGIWLHIERVTVDEEGEIVTFAGDANPRHLATHRTEAAARRQLEQILERFHPSSARPALPGF